MPEHFAAPPNWEWWILLYFFFAGIAGGSYTIGTLIRIFGATADQRAARVAFIVAFVALILCPIFLIVDLGQPLRFTNMNLNASDGGLMFKPWSPMSVGAWGLLLFGVFAFVSFLGAIAETGTTWLDPFSRFLRGTVGAVWDAIGTVFALFIAGYTGVLLAVSNQTVWSDAGWALGGMFLASGLTGAGALLLWLVGMRSSADAGTTLRLASADRNFALLETVLVVIFLVLLAVAGTIAKVLGIWLLLWAVVAIGIIASLFLARVRGLPALTSPALTLLGVLALRAVVIFAAQY